MWCLRSQLISAGRDPNWSDLNRSEKLNRSLRRSNLKSVFSKSLNSQAISSRHDVIHPLDSLITLVQLHFLSGGLLWQTMIVISFPRGHASAPSDENTWNKRHQLVKSLRKLNHHHHHHLVVPPAWISRTLSRHSFLLFIPSGRASGLHLVSSQSCCMIKLVSLFLFCHLRGSTREHPLWPRHRFSCRVLHVWFV